MVLAAHSGYACLLHTRFAQLRYDYPVALCFVGLVLASSTTRIFIVLCFEHSEPLDEQSIHTVLLVSLN